MGLKGLKINSYNNNFKLRVDLICHSVKEAIEISNLLKEHHFETRRTYVYYNPLKLKNSERRLVFIMEKLNQIDEPISLGKFWRFIFAPVQSVSCESYAKDLGMLILRNKIKAWSRGNKTMMQAVKEEETIL